MSERNPFLIEGPAIIAFSGGRTSGLMLYRIIEAHGGKLPDDVVPVFCNTGKEHTKTLDFVKECGERWGVRIRWIEYRGHKEPQQRWREVEYATASREGEPFEALIRARRYLPNPITRFCTQEMKIRPTQLFAEQILGFDHWDMVVGMRWDEPRRVAKLSAPSSYPFNRIAPLARAGVDSAQVREFWAAQSFDLGLPKNDGITALGNCDLCFLKGAGNLASIIAMEPERARWWIRMEQEIGATFHKDRPSYAAMLAQGTMFTDTEDQIDCACTD